MTKTTNKDPSNNKKNGKLNKSKKNRDEDDKNSTPRVYFDSNSFELHLHTFSSNPVEEHHKRHIHSVVGFKHISITSP